VTEHDRTDPRPYVQAVVRELDAHGVKTQGTGDARRPKRAMWIGIDDVTVWESFNWADLGVVEWDEELGWTVSLAHEPGAVRGREHARHPLGLGLVPPPADVASYVARMFATGGDRTWNPRPAYRSAADHDPELEAALAAYLPS
jgi:hypothetical protein